MSCRDSLVGSQLYLLTLQLVTLSPSEVDLCSISRCENGFWSSVDVGVTHQNCADTESIEVHSVCILNLFGVIAVLSGCSSRA